MGVNERAGGEEGERGVCWLQICYASGSEPLPSRNQG